MLIRKNFYTIIICGDMSEWFKVQTSKVCVGEIPPWVRIPLSPNFWVFLDKNDPRKRLNHLITCHKLHLWQVRAIHLKFQRHQLRQLYVKNSYLFVHHANVLHLLEYLQHHPLLTFELLFPILDSNLFRLQHR